MKRHFIINLARSLANSYGFKEHETPIFEHSVVFDKNLGENTDIVSKEMYTFTDKGGDSLTLRPEATASIARLFISHKLFRDVPYKVFYQGPMFRHERPQMGRQRQFTQIGVENLGLKDPKVDAETIELGYRLVKALSPDQNWQVQLNNIGSAEDRENYKKVLVEYLTTKSSELSEDSQKRLTTNPLRILDSKNQTDQELLQEAPSIHEFINAQSRIEFDQIQELLKTLQVPYELNQNLVRGLDYYNDTVFEIINTNLGAQNAVLAGGRYDTLIENMGGPQCPSFGWAAGVERLSLLTETPELSSLKIGVVDMDHSNDAYLMKVTSALRTKTDQKPEIYWSSTGNFSKQMKKCESQNCQYVLIFGPDEVLKGSVQIKNLKTGLQTESKLNDLKTYSFQ
jgi:histidyl-tRNA synthetase